MTIRRLNPSKSIPSRKEALKPIKEKKNKKKFPEIDDFINWRLYEDLILASSPIEEFKGDLHPKIDDPNLELH